MPDTPLTSKPLVAASQKRSKTLPNGWHTNNSYVHSGAPQTNKAERLSPVYAAASWLCDGGFFSDEYSALIKSVGDTAARGNSKFMKMSPEFANKLGQALYDACQIDWISLDAKDAMKIILKAIMDSIDDPIGEQIAAELVLDEL